MGLELGIPASVPPELLAQAFCHASYARETGLGSTASNQRLEFLGDAVLGLVLAKHLFLQYPEVPEGTLTRMRATAVRAEALARAAGRLGLGQYLLLGKGEEATGGRTKPSMLADCLEALVGVLYLATDLATTEAYILERVVLALEEIEAPEHFFDYKTALQELLQRLAEKAPTYIITGTSGPPHRRVFQAEVRSGDLAIGAGEGPSKQAAQQDAARVALGDSETWLAQVRPSPEAPQAEE